MNTTSGRNRVEESSKDREMWMRHPGSQASMCREESQSVMQEPPYHVGLSTGLVVEQPNPQTEQTTHYQSQETKQPFDLNEETEEDNQHA